MTVQYPFVRILVATDFSTCSDAAVALAAKMADDQRAELVALHVVDAGSVPLDAIIHPAAGVPPTVAKDGVDVKSYTARLALRELEQRMGRLPPAPDGVPLRRAAVRHGPPVATIMRMIDELAPGLVVLGTHGRSGIAHLLMGSVAERVARTSLVPVLTVREAVCVDRPIDPGLDDELAG